MSVDILSFFKQLLPVLEKDESVYCLSAWNDQVIREIYRQLISTFHSHIQYISKNNKSKARTVIG